MLDSVSLIWGWQRGSVAGRIENPFAGRRADGPEDIDLRGEVLLEEVAARLGAEHGEVSSRVFPRGEVHLGHWSIGCTDLMVNTSGRVEIRASLPNLLMGRNDVVLTADQTRMALELLATIAREATGCALLELRHARLARADFCWQWVVPSCAKILKALERSWAPPRRAVTTTWAARGMLGGRSVVWGYGTRTVYRWYDKGAERASAGELVPEALLDRVLRFEIQERRPPALESTRVDAYTPAALELALRRPLELWQLEEAGPLRGTARERMRLGFARYLAEHPDELAAMRNDPEVSRSEWYRLSAEARRAAARELVGWRPDVPTRAAESGMLPHADAELAALYPSPEEIRAHEDELERKRRRTLARARVRSEELAERQRRVPTPEELDRFRRENRLARETNDNDRIVMQWRLEQAARFRSGYARLRKLEEAAELAQLRLELGEIVTRARGTLAAAVRAGHAPAAALPWN